MKKHALKDGLNLRMPDLNLPTPLVLKYLTQNAIWWIEYADLDGFRVDTTTIQIQEGIAKWTKSITDEYPTFNMVVYGCKNTSQMAYCKRQSIVQIQNYNSNSHQ
jgi:1,4-alpha-glucan branching enzyme